VNDLASRIVVALVLAPVAIYAVVAGGWPMTALALAAGLVGIHEYCAITRDQRPLTIAGFLGVAAVIVATHQGGLAWSLAALFGTVLVAFWLSAVADVRQSAVVQISVTLFGVVWVGLGLAFLVAIRDIPVPEEWGKWLVLGVLVGVWSSDIAAFVGGRLLGRHKLAKVISPNKTVEGLLVGFLTGTAAAFIVIYDQPKSDPVATGDAFLIALAIAAASPVGDLLESYLKRDAGIKDSGRERGGHGGVLDRIDALLLAGVAAYVAALAVGRT
jgi:phosphatidate cytidylyltransferase